MRIVVNRPMCDGNGYCAQEAPELMSLDKSETAVVLKQTFGEEHRKQAEAAVRVCPKQALRIEE